MVFRSCRNTLKRAHHSTSAFHAAPRMRSVLASAGRAVAGGAALGLASLVMGCAQQTAEPAVTELAPAGTQEVSAPPPGAEEIMGAAGREWVRPAGSPQRGQASYYGLEFTGRTMANGRRFNPRAAVVAHRTLPLGTTVLVKNLSNGRATTATVEDRGPYINGRIVDLAPRLAEHLGMVRQGLAPVEVMPVEVAEAPEAKETPILPPREAMAQR
jgi:rare lipoprotein A